MGTLSSAMSSSEMPSRCLTSARRLDLDRLDHRKATAVRAGMMFDCQYGSIRSITGLRLAQLEVPVDPLLKLIAHWRQAARLAVASQHFDHVPRRIEVDLPAANRQTN